MWPALSGDLGAKEIIRMLGLTPHPEGGHYGETYRAPAAAGARANLTAIYYLLQADEISAWHRVDADEAWLWHAGDPLTLTVGKGAASITLGPDLRAGQRHARPRPARGSTPSGHRSGRSLADGRDARRLDTGLLSGRAWL
jgi:predicted cupin superfamily sugar epimerase